MLLPTNILLVTELAGNQAVLKLSAPTLSELQKALDLGFEPREGKLTRVITGDEDRIGLIQNLIKAGALFIGGPGWSPAEVVAHLKDAGRVQQSYRAILWKNPREYEVRDAA